MSGLSWNTPTANPAMQSDLTGVDALPGGLDGLPDHGVVANVVNPTIARTATNVVLSGIGFIPAAIVGTDGTRTLIDFLVCLRA